MKMVSVKVVASEDRKTVPWTKGMDFGKVLHDNVTGIKAKDEKAVISMMNKSLNVKEGFGCKVRPAKGGYFGKYEYRSTYNGSVSMSGGTFGGFNIVKTGDGIFSKIHPGGTGFKGID